MKPTLVSRTSFFDIDDLMQGPFIGKDSNDILTFKSFNARSDKGYTAEKVRYVSGSGPLTLPEEQSGFDSSVAGGSTHFT